VKSVLIGIGVFVGCYLLGAAMVEFVFMVREKFLEDERNKR
jgi:hypothetical protein